MEIVFSKLSVFFFLFLFVFSVMVSQKTIAIKLEGKEECISVITYERTLYDVLLSHTIYLSDQVQTEKAKKITLQEGMVIQIETNQGLKIIE